MNKLYLFTLVNTIKIVTIKIVTIKSIMYCFLKEVFKQKVNSKYLCIQYMLMI